MKSPSQGFGRFALIGAAALLGVCAWSIPTLSNGQTMAERLGYPEGRAVVLLETVDVGFCPEGNLAAEAALKCGAVTSAAVLPNAPWFEDFARRLRAQPDADVGVNVSLMNPFAGLRWRPLTAAESTSLTDRDGYCPKTLTQFLSMATAEDVGREIDAQIAHARKHGVEPTHLSAHHGSVYGRPDLLKELLDASRRHWIPAVLVDLSPERLARFQAEGVPLDDRMTALIASYTLPTLDELVFAPRADSYEAKKAATIETIGKLPAGLTLFSFHPAQVSHAMDEALGEEWRQRVWEARLLGDADVRDAFAEKGALFTTWREVMRRYDGQFERQAEIEEASAIEPENAVEGE